MTQQPHVEGVPSGAGAADATALPAGSTAQDDACAARVRLRRVGAAAGIVGPILLVVYFAVPALSGWPYAGASAQVLADYAGSHRLLFYAGGWIQVTGALLSIVFFLVLVQLSGARDRLAGAAALVGCALLLAVVVIEAALLEAVPVAAAAGDHATVATAFALSNGVFARVFPLAPAPLLFAATGAALLPSAVLPRIFGHSALVVAALFVLAGIAAIFGTPGLVFAVVMSVVQALWILTAAIALARVPSRPKTS